VFFTAGRSAHSPSPRDAGLKPDTSTPVASTPRSSSAQRELEIPKLSPSTQMEVPKLSPGAQRELEIPKLATLQ